MTDQASLGVLEVTPKGAGFLRRPEHGYLPGRDDVHVGRKVLQQYRLRTGDEINGGEVGHGGGRGKSKSLLSVAQVNGRSPEELAQRPQFNELTAIHPNQQLTLDCNLHRLGAPDFTNRVIDLISPVGLGPRAGTVRWETAIGRHDNDDLTALDGPTVVYPGTYGGVLTPPATADGVVYAAVVNAPATLEPDETAYFGADLGTADGEVVAIDARTGRIRWATPVPGDPLGGATVVGDLVMTALLDGTVLALDRRTGEIVRSWAAGGGINGWMAALDDVVLVPVGTSRPPALVALGLPQG